jgi:hypothetical protein
MKEEFNRSGPVMHLLLRYTQALITQMAQTAVCNRHHSLDQQLCRWLLLSLDRLPGNELVMTQELIANMLGVRREGVTEAALQVCRSTGLIRYARGHITVLDRPAWSAHLRVLCVVKKEYDRLLPMLGIPVFLGVNMSPLEAMVQGAGAGAAHRHGRLSTGTGPECCIAYPAEPVRERGSQPAGANGGMQPLSCGAGPPGALAADDAGPLPCAHLFHYT